MTKGMRTCYGCGHVNVFDCLKHNRRVHYVGHGWSQACPDLSLKPEPKTCKGCEWVGPYDVGRDCHCTNPKVSVLYALFAGVWRRRCDQYQAQLEEPKPTCEGCLYDNQPERDSWVYPNAKIRQCGRAGYVCWLDYKGYGIRCSHYQPKGEERGGTTEQKEIVKMKDEYTLDVTKAEADLIDQLREYDSEDVLAIAQGLIGFGKTLHSNAMQVTGAEREKRLANAEIMAQVAECLIQCAAEVDDQE